MNIVVFIEITNLKQKYLKINKFKKKSNTRK